MRNTLAMTLAVTLLASTAGLAMAQATVNTDAGVSVETPAGDAGVNASGNADANANGNANGKASAEVASNSDKTYGSVISSIKSSSTVDLSGVTDDSNVSIVLVSSLQGDAASEASALDNALTENASSMTTLHSSIEANAAIKAKLEAGGYSADDVVAVSSGVDGSVTIYVDDRA